MLPSWGLLPWIAQRRWPLWAALALMSAAGVTMIASAPEPHIDVFFLLQGSTKGLLSGDDMYRQQWAEQPCQLPLARPVRRLSLPALDLGPAAAFRLIFGDIRYGLVAFLAVAAGDRTAASRWRG